MNNKKPIYPMPKSKIYGMGLLGTKVKMVNKMNLEHKTIKRIFLDTNSIIKYFYRLLDHRRGKKSKFDVPKECLFLKESKLEFFISILNQAEVFRQLRSEWGCNNKEIEEMWHEFVKWLPLKIIDEVNIDEGIIEVTKKLNLKKKTLINFIHLFVAKKFNLYFYTGDKQIKKQGEKYYNKIITYGSLKREFEKKSYLFILPVFSLPITLSNLGPMFFKNSFVDIILSGIITLMLLLFSFIVLSFILHNMSQKFINFSKSEVKRG